MVGPLETPEEEAVLRRERAAETITRMVTIEKVMTPQQLRKLADHLVQMSYAEEE